MWQRKQTIYLLLTTILSIGTAILAQGELGALLAFLPGGLIGAIAFVTIFLYNNQKQRKMQMMLCRLSQLFLLAWLGYACYNHFVALENSSMIIYPFYMLASIIVLELARRGVKADYDMIRSQDRIR